MPAEWTGIEELKAKLQNIMDSSEPALKAAGVMFLTLAQQSIISGGPGFAPQKRPYKPVHQLLWEFGTLLRSLAFGDSNNIMEESEHQIVVGSNVVYARALALGDAAHILPARNYFDLNDDKVDRVKEAYLNVLIKATQGVNQ